MSCSAAYGTSRSMLRITCESPVRMQEPAGRVARERALTCNRDEVIIITCPQ